jgi:hypothetical protein
LIHLEDNAMRRNWLLLLPVAALAFALIGHTGTSRALPGGGAAQKFPAFDSVVKGAKEYDGLFKLYQKDEKLYAEIRAGQLDTPFLCPIAIARGMGAGGETRNFGDQWVLLFRRVDDRIFLVRRNVRFHAKSSAAAAKAVETTYTDSVLMSLRIQSIHPIRHSILINFNDIFMTDFAQLRRGYFDVNRSAWHKIKAFSRNIELQVAATYGGAGWGGDAIIDGRGTTAIIHYGLCKLPDSGYHPRLADDRVGHFLSVVKDYSNDAHETPFLRYINRWRLERSDGSTWKEGGKLVPPKKKIVFCIEKSVPDEYRTYVRDGILEWNKAFAKIGFRDAIEVRQQENEDFDPEDINYNTFRWITSDNEYAIGPSRANPLTGEIIDADILFDASMVRYYRQAASLFSKGGATAIAEEVVSPIQAIREGAGLPRPEGWDDRAAGQREGGPGRLDAFARARFHAIQNGRCECGPCLKRELNLLALTLALRRDKKGKDKGNPAILTEELIGQAIKEVAMHEVGHTLGLRHNFKASTMLDNKDLHNTEITRKKGLVASVMDYCPINLAPKGVKQGDYFTSTLGPYDYWAIEYAYKPLSGGTEGERAELKKIASKCGSPGLDYGTDEDMYTSSDPYINTFDLGRDPMKFAQDRILLAEELLGKLAEKGSDKGEGYQRTRQAFRILLQEYGNGAHLISRFIGGVTTHRNHRGDPGERDPLVPVSGAKQRAALKFLQEHILTDKPFHFSPKLLRKLAPDRWLHWGNQGAIMSPVEFPLHEHILRIQQVVLGHALSPDVLSRIQNNGVNGDKEARDKPLALAEVFRSLTDGIWPEPLNRAKGKRHVQTSIVRRNLQRRHLEDLSSLVLGSEPRGRGFRFFSSPSAPPDARSLARAHLKEIDGKIKKALDDNVVADETTRAHLQECRERIAKVLNASLQVSEP